MEVVIDQKNLVSKKDIGELVSFLPTKDEFYTEMEKIYKKLEDIEMEKNILVSRTAENTRGINRLDKIHPGGIHQTA